MTARERAVAATWDSGGYDWTTLDREQLELAVEQAINAAVQEDRRGRPHTFTGRTDRGCELCGEPDRDEIHIASREMMRNCVKLAVEEEREACASLAEEACLDVGATALEAEGIGRRTRDAIAARIRARSNGGTK